MKTLAGLVLFALAAPVILAVAAGWLALAVGLHVLALALWIPAGRRVLFVYSDSPNWKAHIEAAVLPRLPATAAVLNWSERARWPFWSLAVWLFMCHGGARNFAPLAIVLRPFHAPRLFRFRPAFRDLKHGRAEPLRELEAEFFQAI